MREFKFRAWHPGYQDRLNNIPPVMLYEDYPGHCFMWLKEKQPIQVMQFTGLHDKNGKEIYEGDILSCPEMYPMQVAYDVEETAFVRLDTDGTLYIILPTKNKVIGNIYENPELLEPT